MVRLHGTPSPAIEAAAREASAWRSAGHSCAFVSPELRPELLGSRVIGEPGAERPLILDPANRLYLHRYWQYEQRLAEAIGARVAAAPPALDAALLEADLHKFLPVEKPDRAADQRAAARTAAGSRFCLITGGPGTGKTRTVAVVLALLASQAAGKPLRVLLAAPTGKAAIRLTESIRQVLDTIAPGTLPGLEAMTLHRLLGLTPNSAHPRWDEAHPLAADTVIVDEASMIDLALMAKLFAAVPPAARLILLGDSDQLASVETGHVLGDICAAGREAPQGPLGGSICELRENFRVQRDSDRVRELSGLVNAGAAEQAVELLESLPTPDLTGKPLPPASRLAEHLAEPIVAGFRAALSAASPAEALAALGSFRLLCALREGPYGVANLNRMAESALARAGLLVPEKRHYSGRVIMVLRNDYQLRLYNGDIGILLPDPASGGDLRAWFPGEKGGARALPPSRLPDHETAWAMTVHKSQGSEFSRLLLILPDQDTPVLTRELIYTAITRARIGVELWSRPEVLAAAIHRQTRRTGGLREKLRGT